MSVYVKNVLHFPLYCFLNIGMAVIWSQIQGQRSHKHISNGLLYNFQSRLKYWFTNICLNSTNKTLEKWQFCVTYTYCINYVYNHTDTGPKSSNLSNTLQSDIWSPVSKHGRCASMCQQRNMANLCKNLYVQVSIWSQ